MKKKIYPRITSLKKKEPSLIIEEYEPGRYNIMLDERYIPSISLDEIPEGVIVTLVYKNIIVQLDTDGNINTFLDHAVNSPAAKSEWS